jgi:LPS export ABC transporter protein LptC
MFRIFSISFKSRAIFSLLAPLVALLFVSCENDMMTVVKLSTKDSIPDVTINNVIVKKSENGKMTFELTAPKMISFQTNDAYTELPVGMKIVFFDSLMQPKTEITANYGISWDNKRTMQARGNVVIRNFQKQEQLNTESLFYDLNLKKVSTEEFVKITSPTKIVTGKGMESDELFENWSLRSVNATIYVEDDKSESDTPYL